MPSMISFIITTLIFSTALLICCSVTTSNLNPHDIENENHVNSLSRGGINNRSSFSLLCPATSLLNFSYDGYFSYPLDIFETKLLTQINSKIKNSESQSSQRDTEVEVLKSMLYQCSAQNTEHHVCSNKLLHNSECPIHSDNVDMVFKRSSEWLYKSASSVKNNNSSMTHNLKLPFLYRMWKTLSNPKETIRLIIFGGSASAGSEAEGCWCNVLHDKRCAVFNHSLYTSLYGNGEGKESSLECAWITYFYKYLQSISLANIKMIYHAHGGTNTIYGSQIIPSYFKSQPFTYRDIIFFDYSMNEARDTLYDLSKVHKQEKNMEKAIRAVFQTSESYIKYEKRIQRQDSNKNHDILKAEEKEDNIVDTISNMHNKNLGGKTKITSTAGWPVLILTETWPFGNGYVYVDPSSEDAPKLDYTHAYTKLANHYQLPIFSFKDSLWSSYWNISNKKDLQKTLAFRHHPYFYQHMFMSDVFSAAFHKELQRAYDFHTNITTTIIKNRQKQWQNHHHSENEAFILDGGNKSTNSHIIDRHRDHLINSLIYDIVINQLQTILLPPITIQFNDSAMCEVTVPPLLDLYATDFIPSTVDIGRPISNRNQNDIIGSYFTSSHYVTSNNIVSGNTTSSAMDSIPNTNINNIVNKAASNNSSDKSKVHLQQQLSWKLYSDSKQKYGWIDELPIIASVSNEEMTSLSQDDKQQQHRTLTFVFNDPEKFLFSFNHMLIIQFLGTYHNAGMFTVQLCGYGPISVEVDALYPDRNTRKVSVTEFQVLMIKKVDLIQKWKSEEYEKCYEKYNLQNNISNNNNKEVKNKIDLLHNTTYFLEVIHKPVKDCWDSKNQQFVNGDCEARTQQQKVKILAIKLCRSKGDKR